MRHRALAAVAIVALQGGPMACRAASQRVTEGLEEEKSYTRRAMEAYRKDPRIFHGDKDVLEIWSRADYIAEAVVARRVAAPWVATSDKIEFLSAGLQHDPNGVPFCVLRQVDKVVVLDFRTRAGTPCSAQVIQNVDVGGVESGDLEFSGRRDFWIYVLKPSSMK